VEASGALVGSPNLVVVVWLSHAERFELERPFTHPPRGQEFMMSKVNGDKSRYNRVRRQNAAKRMRNRKLLKNANLQAKPAAVAEKATPVVV